MAECDIRKEFWRGGIEYVRVNKIDDDEEGRQLIFGSLIVTDCEGHKVVYHRPSVMAESKGPGEYLSLSGPVEGIIAEAWFSISVTLWVILCDHDKEITKEIAKGEVFWDPIESQSKYPSGKPQEQQVFGKHGSVTVGYSTITKALHATINYVVMMNDLPVAEQIYGTIKACRFLSSSSQVSSPTTSMLFDKSPNECVQVNPGQSIPLTRPFFPVPLDSDLTIDVELWNHANDQIAVGKLLFTPKYGTQTKNITDSSCSISTNVEREYYRCNVGDESITYSWHVSIS